MNSIAEIFMNCMELLDGITDFIDSIFTIVAYPIHTILSNFAKLGFHIVSYPFIFAIL